ncbi:MAG: hypothetical protein JNM10_03780, partial [Planctomycetia bacterium]|nr:hypothetical protein [Planctomycetia bacterium]
MDAAFALSLHPLSYAEANFGIEEGLLEEGAEVEVARRHFSEPLVTDLDVLELAELRPGARSRALSRELAERYPSSTRCTAEELWEWLCVEWLVAHWDARPAPLEDVDGLTADFGYPERGLRFAQAAVGSGTRGDVRPTRRQYSGGFAATAQERARWKSSVLDA